MLIFFFFPFTIPSSLPVYKISLIKHYATSHTIYTHLHYFIIAPKHSKHLTENHLSLWYIYDEHANFLFPSNVWSEGDFGK
jgi:hypothetical protein